MSGFLWQDFNRNLLPYLNAKRNVELPLLLAGVGGRQRKQRTMDLLESVGLRSRAFADVHTMSGGEQQRLALCVALAGEPELLLADEPTGELDTETGLEIYELLRSLTTERGLSILVVTHDVALAQRTDRVVRLADGRIAMQGRLGAAEVLAVDARGMVQVPRSMLLEAGIEDRVEAEVVDDGVLLRPHRETGIGGDHHGA